MKNKLDEDIIDSVMQKVVELNKDKLPESSLVNVLASVYLDAKSKLKRKGSEPNIGTNVPTCIPSATVKGTSMTVSDKKKLQWEREKAELALLAACDPWNKSFSQSATKLPQTSLPFSITASSASTVVDSVSSSHIPQMESSKITNLSSSTKLPALTSMAFAASQDIEIMKREEQRRQWKADLDEQVRQQRLAHKQKLIEERRTQETSFEPHRQRVPEMPGVTDLPDQTTLTESSMNAHAPRSSLDAHPSASHFTSSLVISDCLQSAVPVTSTELECTASVEPTVKVQFNRMRGFTQQMYSSPTDDAVRARRAEEIQRANLEMIEEKRRQREKEKLNRIMEEKLEKERSERECARLKALAEAELREREEREREEKLKTQLLFDTLKQAREEAASQKRHTRLARLQQTESEMRSAYRTTKQSLQQQQYHNIPPSPPPQQQQQQQQQQQPNFKSDVIGSHYFSQHNNESLTAIRCVDAQTDTTAFTRPQPTSDVDSTRLPQEDAGCQTDATGELARAPVLSGQKAPGKATRKMSKLVGNSRAPMVQQKASVNPALNKCQSTGAPRSSKPPSQTSFNKQAKSVPRTVQGTLRNRPINTSQSNTSPGREVVVRTLSSSLVDVTQDDYERKVYAPGGSQRKPSSLTYNTSDSQKVGKPVRTSLKQNSDSLVINMPTSEVKQTQVNGTVGISSREIPTHIPVPVFPIITSVEKKSEPFSCIPFGKLNNSLPLFLTVRRAGMCASVGFVQSSYPSTLRQGIPDAHPGGRLPGLPPTEMAQREWDRLCMDYQREKGEPPGPRIPLSSRQSVVYDSNGYPIMSAEVGMPPSGAVMLPSGQFIMDHPSCQLPPRHYSTQIDGLGPPVVMVPPNNSNPTVAGSAYPVTAAGPMSAAPIQQYRYMSSMGHACQEPIPTGLLSSGQKRPYYGPPSEPWPPTNSGAMMTSMPTSDNGVFPGSLPSPGAGPNPRVSNLGSVAITVQSSIPNVPVPAIVTGSTNSRGVGKAGGKKRKTAGSGRSNSTAIPTTSVAAVSPQQQQQQQQLYAYSKPLINSTVSSLTPSKPLYPAPYMADPVQAGFHPHRSVYMSSPNHPPLTQPCLSSHPNYSGMDPYFAHYTEVTGGPNTNRSIGASGLSIESRRNPMASAYMHSPDGSGFGCEMNPGMRPPTSCTQHLTSASLASLARLSQLSGPEGPYVPSSSSGALGSSLGPSSVVGGYSGRSYHPDSSIMPGPPQVMRGHSVAPSAVTMRSHESDPTCSSGLSHSIPSPLLHSKFGPQMYHGPTQPQHQQQQSQSISSQSLLPPPPLPQQQQQSQTQQPPSIQVNNTFFNAQLNVQQMNYQHVSAPGSTGQMQIHFVQQHHDQSGGPNTGVRSSRQPDSTTRMNSSGSGNGDFYPSAAQPNHLCSYGPDPGVPRAQPYSNQSGPNELQVKNEGSVSTCSTLQPVSVSSTAPGYGNTSIQITPRTPHTIQYLPTVAPSHSETQHPLQAYNSSDSPQTVRTRIVRNGNSSNQLGSTEPAPFNSLDLPPSETARQVSFNPGSMYNNHSSANLHMASHSQQQQQQYGLQSMSQSAYSQPVNPNKTVLQQHISARSATSAAVSWGDPTDRHFDCNPSAPPGITFASSGPSAASNGQSMPVAPGGRSVGPPSHQSARTNLSAYPPGYLAESSDLTSADPPASGWSADPTGGPFLNRSGPNQYGRHHSSASRQDGPQQSYRQQQFSQQQQQQQQQQHHQMFMSSSISNFSEGNNASGQVQFMMSASSSSSSMSAANVQTSSSSILGGDVNTCANSTSSVGGTSGTAESRSSSMCNLSSGLKSNSQYETIPFVNSKRNVLVSGGSDDLKATGASGPGSFIAGLSSQHVLQSGCSRMSWQPTSSIPGGASVPGDPHLGGPYSNSYGTTNFPSASSVTMLGPSNNSTVGFPDTQINSRDLLGHQPASNCDLSTGLPQPFSSIVP
ncbi:hypothetical protein EG68_07407 [Paragonimus skrjabini miyazakii]|uniref:Uncharacterized protein n=1 Tax=Paragonimus skrjabini miyazakii TaxID=59628 RepID=A0A8S9YD76_9TREM|nr:hypothetical protein EG68_07407 [Paragonimus skrjabini miyazakii]